MPLPRFLKPPGDFSKKPAVVEETTISIEPKEEELESPGEESQEEELLSQDTVRYYSPGNCGECNYFVSEGESCKKVSGPISANGSCVIFEPKTSTPVMEETPVA